MHRDDPVRRFFAEVWRASPGWACTWWALVALRGAVPAAVTLTFGWLVAAVTDGEPLGAPLIGLGACFAASLVIVPVHQLVSSNLGSRVSEHLTGSLEAVCSGPHGLAHLERADLIDDLTMARDFDLGIMGPPLDIAMDFTAQGLVAISIGLAAAVLLFPLAWWAPILLLAAWAATHRLLRESGVWRDRNTAEVRALQRRAEYAYRLAVDAGPAKEVRLFGLAGWVVERFVTSGRALRDAQFEATRLREKSLAGAVLIAVAANVAVAWAIAARARQGELTEAEVVVFVQAAIGVSSVAFGGLSWVIDGAAAPVMALQRLRAAIDAAGDIASGSLDAPPSAPTIEFRGIEFAYAAAADRAVLRGIDLTIPAGSAVAVVGANGAGKTTIIKLLSRLYDPTAGTITIDGTPATELDVGSWRSRLSVVFQDYLRLELPVRDNVAPLGAPDDVIRAALRDAGADHLATGDLDLVLSKGYPNGTDLSGGQWQRVALARTLCAVRQGATVVVLDEPTAQLDVRGELEIFRRVLGATEACTTILVSHRFSTVRLADLIVVVEDGLVVEQGTHDALMAAGGRYRTMFDLQASRFDDPSAPRDGEQLDDAAVVS
jgi:ATP-binding cassette, subfamily B, bacterial